MADDPELCAAAKAELEAAEAAEEAAEAVAAAKRKIEYEAAEAEPAAKWQKQFQAYSARFGQDLALLIMRAEKYERNSAPKDICAGVNLPTGSKWFQVNQALLNMEAQ